MIFSKKKEDGFKNTKTMAFGLDISDFAIKVVQLNQANHGLAIQSFHREALPPGIVINGEIKDFTTLSNILHTVVTNKKLHLKESVVAALPEAQTFLQTIRIPRKGDMPFDDRAIEILPEYLPFELDQVYFDIIEKGADEDSWTALVAAAPKPIVDSYLQLLDAVNVLPYALDLELAAVSNALIPTNDEHPTPRAIIELGASRASLLLHDYDSIQFTTEVAIAGSDVTKEIAKQLELSPEEAEQAKRTCGLDPSRCEGVLRKILEQQVAEASRQVAEANEFYRTHYNYGRPITEVILSGGGAHLLQLDTILSSELGIPVRIGNPWQNHAINHPADDTPMSLSVALGLALRGLK